MTSGSNNTFVGGLAGLNLTSGSNNTFVGTGAGSTTTVENSNVAIGASAATAGGVSNGTAIGNQSFVGQNNSVVLGAVNGVNGATAYTRVGIGTPTPSTDLEIRNNTASAMAPILTLKNANGAAGSSPTIDFATYQPGANAPSARFRVADNTYSAEMIFYTKVPGAATNALQERMRITSNGIVGINRPSPDVTTMLDVNGDVKFGGDENLTGGITVAGPSDLQGTVHLTALGTAGGTALCRNASGFIAQCSSSIRYKDSVENYRNGMTVIRQLRPVSFRWKADGQPDLGFVAEEGEKIEPRLTVYNAAGQVEGVKYDRITALLVDALQQQQSQMDREREDLEKENADLRERVQRLERAIEHLGH